MKSKHNKAIRNLSLQNPQCVTNRMTSHLGDNIFFFKKMLYSTRHCLAANTLPCALQWNPRKDVPQKDIGMDICRKLSSSRTGQGKEICLEMSLKPQRTDQRTSLRCCIRPFFLILEKTKLRDRESQQERAQFPASHLGWAISQERLKLWRESRRDETNIGQGIMAAFKEKRCGQPGKLFRGK